MAGVSSTLVFQADISKAIPRLGYAPRCSVADGLDETTNGYVP